MYHLYGALCTSSPGMETLISSSQQLFAAQKSPHFWTTTSPPHWCIPKSSYLLWRPKQKKSTKQKGIWLIFRFSVVVCLLIKETLLIIICLFLKARNFSSETLHQKKCYAWKIQTSKFKIAAINLPLYPLVKSLKNKDPPQQILDDEKVSIKSSGLVIWFSGQRTWKTKAG